MFSTTTNFDKMVNDIFGKFDQPVWNTTVTTKSEYYHSEKTDDGYILELPVVGLAKEDLSIKISNGKLEIKGGKEDHRWTPSFEKNFSLPKDINTKKVEAKVENGLLTVTIGISKDSETVVKII
jgi:HSP20 family protein